MKRPRVKTGDLIIFKYKFGNEWKDGIGYVYKAVNYFVGASCKSGGVTNVLVTELKDVQKVEFVQDIFKAITLRNPSTVEGYELAEPIKINVPSLDEPIATKLPDYERKKKMRYPTEKEPKQSKGKDEELE